MGRLEVMAARSNTTDAVSMRPSTRDRWRLACVSALAVVLVEVVAIITGGTGEAAAPTVNATFNVATQLLGTSGAVPTAVVDDSTGGMIVIGSTGASAGCTLSTLGRDGASTRYFGRTPGGSNCRLATVAGSPGSDGLAVVSQTASGLVGGRSSNGGGSFAWSIIAGLGIPRALASDPMPAPGSNPDLFLLVQNAHTGVPYIGVSTNNGMTFALGSALINPADVPVGAWQGPGPTPVVGNLIARETPTGLMLYSVFETGTGSAAQPGQAAPTHALTQVYEAVGVVSPATASVAEPSVTWRDAAVYSAPTGTSLDPSGAVTAVDGNGRMYTAFSDGRHLYVKGDQTGFPWNLFTPPLIIDTAATGIPAGTDAAFAPSIAAGGGGMADVAWLVGTGGVAGAPVASRSWAVFMAQTIDGGSSWRAYRVTRGVVHDGVPAGSVQLAIDSNGGAASLAYSDDLASPGMPSLYATRQCGGLSATTGGALAGGCAAPRPTQSVLPGSICSGPQVRNRAFDAIHNGANIPALDVYTARFGIVDVSTEAVTITVGNISFTEPSGVTESLWRVTWSQGGVEYYAQAAMVAGRAATYSVGVMNADGSPRPGTSVSGHMATLSGGSNTAAITIDIPLAAVGRPAPGTLMSHIAADSLAVFNGPISTPQLVDHAPDGSAGAVFTVQQTCPPNEVVPEVPSAALLPLMGGIAGIVVAVKRRRRSPLGADE
jgi:hypothetical protein